MKNWQYLCGCGLITLICNVPAKAQITPDGTVGTTVTPNLVINGIMSDRIDGGLVKGNNLFQSFSNFNIDTGRGVYFSNPAGIENIFTRVTGSNPSKIDGILGVLGNANLFFINPNGIVFGANAKLDVLGSFLGTTASSINFADGTVFSATNPQKPLLTVSVPVGLGFGSNPGSIINQSLTSSKGEIVGLQVQPLQTLGLVGGEIIMTGGYLTNPSGRIELGSVGDNSFVSLFPTNLGFALGYAEVKNFQNIQLSSAATVNASGVGGGELQIFGRQVSLRDGSRVINQTQGSQSGGMLTVKASELVELSGTAPDPSKKTADNLIVSGLITTTVGTGNAGAIAINTPALNVLDGAVIATSSLGAGNGGDVTINANLVEFDGIAYSNELLTRFRLGTVQLFDLRNGIRTEAWNSGNGGDITINTLKLIARDGAQISSGSANGSGIRTGNAGSLTVNASDAIELSGFSPDGRLTTVLLSGTLGTGAGNDLTINTRQLILRDGGALNSGTSGRGAGGNLTVNAEEFIQMTGARSNITSGAGLIRVPGQSGKAPAGNATINTDSLIVQDGAQIFTATAGESIGGSLTINAREKVQVSGVSPDGQLISGILGDARSSGNAGSIRINTGKLLVENRGRVAVDSTGSGNAGNLEIVADSIELNNAGTINAATKSGEGGNIILSTQELRLRNNSSISATAGNNGNGGNITIDADTMVALENSDTNANAFQGNGGNINITTSGIFRSPDSDITASSQLGISGIVNITNPNLNQENALVEQPTNLFSAEQVVANSCLTRSNAHSGKFVVTGNGGLPETPDSTFIPYEVTQVQAIATTQTQLESEKVNTTRTWKLGDPIVEAKQLLFTSNGRMVLSANTSEALPNPQAFTCTTVK